MIFGALRSKGHAEVAKALGVSESTFSEWLQKHGDRVAQLLTAIDHKAVPIIVKCYEPDYLERIMYFAEIGIRHARSNPALEFEDDAER